MKLSESVKPISFLKAHASEILRDIKKNKKNHCDHAEWRGHGRVAGHPFL